MSKRNRQAVILSLLEQEVISSQEDLRLNLEKKAFKVTQATLSRDLKELGVVKRIAEDGAYKYAVGNRPNEVPVRSCEASGNVIVIKTETGLAAAVAYRIDDMRLSEVLGTVAGEDTLLVVLAQGCNAESLRSELWRRLVSGRSVASAGTR